MTQEFYLAAFTLPGPKSTSLFAGESFTRGAGIVLGSQDTLGGIKVIVAVEPEVAVGSSAADAAPHNISRD